MVKFLRRVTHRHSKLGKGRKKKQTWRNPTGRHNKMRTRQKGNPPVVTIGYRTNKKVRYQIKEKIPILVENEKDIEKLNKNNIAIIAKIGKKKKIELVNKISEKGIQISNVNIKKLLKKSKEKSK